MLQSPAHVHRLLGTHAVGRPDDVAFRFVVEPRALDDPESVEVWTYAELHSAALRLAAALCDRAEAGSRVLLLHPPGSEFVVSFFGCLYAGLVAVPSIHPNSTPAVERLEGIVSDARPALFVSSSGSLDACAEALERSGHGDVRGVASDLARAEVPEPAGPPPAPGRTTPAFLQYTSGSTRTPRGVRVTHDNLAANAAAMADCAALTPGDKQVSWLPPYHDMGLIVGILQPIATGAEAILLSPLAFLVDPLCWLETISHFGGTFSGAPNFGFELCVRKADDARCAGLRLSTWKAAFTGAEPIRRATLERFAARFASAGFEASAFMPAYGLAEATLCVTARRLGTGFASAAPAADFGKLPGEARFEAVSTGPPVQETSVRVVDPETREPLPEGVVGELWIQGAGVADGYWDASDDADSPFRARLSGREDEGDHLRTGDLGFVKDGEVYVTGRIKDLVILQGQNHYPQDIEETAFSADGRLRAGCTAAFAVDVDGEERLVVVQECKDEPQDAEADEIADAIVRAVRRHHGVDVHEVVLIEKRTIPKTSAGKIRRRATRDALANGALKVFRRFPARDA